MPKYIDFQLEKNEYNSSKKLTDKDALVLAIRNILLSKPGNFPFNPTIGVNIKKYQFDILDDTTIRSIQKEIDKNISEYIPNISSLYTTVRKITDENNRAYLAISVSSVLNGSDSTVNFVLTQDGNEVKLFNEIY